MSALQRSIPRFLLLSAAMMAFLVIAPPSAEAQGRRLFNSTSVCQPPCVIECVPCVPCPTIYKAGSEGDDLQVHVVGKTFDTIEAYFREEYYRETLPLTNVHCGRVSLAPKNPYGTFVVQLGACGDSIKAYGWKKGQFKPTTTKIITPEKGTPLNLSWVTPRILKATYGVDKSLIIRFNDSDEGWSLLHSDGPTP